MQSCWGSRPWALHLKLRIAHAHVFGNIWRINSERVHFTPSSCHIRGNVWSWVGFLFINVSMLVLARRTYYFNTMFSASYGFEVFKFSWKYYFVFRNQESLKTMLAVNISKRLREHYILVYLGNVFKRLAFPLPWLLLLCLFKACFSILS